jgi:hypothetical protein
MLKHRENETSSHLGGVVVCVCVCVREREREREKNCKEGREKHRLNCRVTARASFYLQTLFQPLILHTNGGEYFNPHAHA